LLEYEYALQLADQKQTNIFILCVAKEANLGGVKCKVKFPTSREAIARRLQMYANTQRHQHRDQSKGPLVSETMGKLLGNLTNPRGSNFAHVDPDDPAAKIPAILSKLDDTESGYRLARRTRMFWQDISYLKTKAMGIFWGIILPVISLLFILTARSARHQAFRFGVILGHGLVFAGAAAFAFYLAFYSMPNNCTSDYLGCTKHYQTFVNENQELKFCLQDSSGNNSTGNNSTSSESFDICDEIPPVDWAKKAAQCVVCFCSNWLYYCDGLESNQKAYLFLGILSVVVAFGLFAYAKYLVVSGGKKKARVGFA